MSLKHEPARGLTYRVKLDAVISSPFVGIHTPKTVTALGRILLTRKATLNWHNFFSEVNSESSTVSEEPLVSRGGHRTSDRPLYSRNYLRFSLETVVRLNFSRNSFALSKLCDCNCCLWHRKNEFFRTRNKFQKSFRNDVLPTDVFKNRQKRKGVVHKKVEMKALLEAVVG